MDKHLDSVYHEPSNPGAYGGVVKFARAAGVPLKKAKDWLEYKDAYTLHKPQKKTYQRRRTIVGGIDDQWQSDIVDLSSLSQVNDGYKFILTCIDVFSKYAWAVPLKTKSSKDTLSAFQKIMVQSGRTPRRIQTDRGTEFFNSRVYNYFRRINVHHFSTYNDDIKAAVIERFNRTLKSKMFRYFTKTKSSRYIDVLDDMLKGYNSTYHRSIGRTPESVNFANQEDVWQKLYQVPNLKHPQYILKPGDFVRLAQSRLRFKKGYLPNWGEELFVIKSVRQTTPITYVVEDLKGEVIKGAFYHEELQKVKKKDIFEVEKVLKRRGNRLYVRWKGYDTSFDSWIPTRNVTQHSP